MIMAMPLMMWQCTQVKDWQDPKDGVAPGQVSNPQVENFNGGAKITYTLPADNDLLGVKAVYSLDSNDELREAYASASKNDITLEGYGNTEEHTVTLYALDKSGNESVPVQVAIRPLTPPVELVRQTLSVNETFGGLYLTWDNVKKKEIAITLYVADSTGYMQPYDTHYSNSEVGSYSFRGLSDVLTDFRVEIRDRWNNYAAPLETALTPMTEENIFGRDEYNQVIWKYYGWDDNTAIYRGDISRANSGNIGTITDGTLYGGYSQMVNFSNLIFPAAPSILFCPYYLTIDMGKQASYSRFTMWMGNRSPIGSAVMPNVFSLWGTNNPRPVDVTGDLVTSLQYWTEWETCSSVEINGTGEWMNDWEKLGEYRLVFPSGATHYVAGQVTAEDQTFIQDGFQYDIDPSMTNKSFRYLRFRVEGTTTDQGQIMLGELRFFGRFDE
jgi:hypothetical protein